MQARLSAGDTAPDFQVSTPWSDDIYGFESRPDESTAVIFFLRYYGCLVCQLDIQELISNADRLRDHNISPYIVIQSAPEVVRSQLLDCPIPIVCDPQSQIYLRYGVQAGNILQFLHPKGLIRGAKSIMRGNRHGAFEGKETQLPAVFIIDADNVIQHAHYGRHISDVPSLDDIIRSVNSKKLEKKL